MNINPEAQSNLAISTAYSRDHAARVFAQLAAGFTVTWFRELSPRIWIALVKAEPNVATQFGLTHECIVLGNAFERDFHQATLARQAPAEIRDRPDPSLLFVASDCPQADPICAAFAEAKRIRLVLLKTEPIAGDLKSLYSILSRSLWRRDLFGQTEPVRSPGEFFGREASVDELLAKVMAGSPVAVFGLRKVGKSSLLCRVTDLLAESNASANIVAQVAANSASIKSGRWTDLACQLLQAWKSSFQSLRSRLQSKVDCSLNKLQNLLATNNADASRFAIALQKDIDSLAKSLKALCHEQGLSQGRIVALIDECDHVYPHLPDAGYWRRDFFTFWNTMQSIKRGMNDTSVLVYVLCGLSPSGVERGSLENQPNPLFETQQVFLAPMPPSEAGKMMREIGQRMGLTISQEAVDECYSRVGGHPLMLRKFGSALHEAFRDRAAVRHVTGSDARKVWERRKRDFFNQAYWILEYLSQIAPEEGRLLRSIADGGMDAFLSDWKDNEFREVFANHLERYGLIRLDDESIVITLPVIREALRKPPVDQFPERRAVLRDIVDSIESAIRARIEADFTRAWSSEESVDKLIGAIPSNSSNRGIDRNGLLGLAELGIDVVLQSLNWGDYILILEKHYDTIAWVGIAMAKEERMVRLRAAVRDAHIVRHNNDYELRKVISGRSFDVLVAQMHEVRDMFTG